MKYISLEERNIRDIKYHEFIEKLYDDLTSKKPYSEKQYLQKFDNMIKDNKCEIKSKCVNHNNNDGCNNLFSNYYSSNNVQISGLNQSNYIGNSTPSVFN